MENYKAFYEFVKGVMESKDSASHSQDKIDQIKSAITLMEIITKAPQ